MATTQKKFQDQEREAPIHGDILEAIFSHVPLIDLVPARHVSKTWNRAVSSSLRHVNPTKPWLMVHTQSHRDPHATTTHAYDPRSRLWMDFHAPPMNHLSAPLRSSHSALLYTLTPTTFSFSSDALHLTWHHARAPRVWRTDPIVARVGNHVVVAGGACDFEDDPLAVEMYDTEALEWVTCQSMPEMLKDSTASTWLSVAVAGERMHVTEKNSGVTYSFDPKSKKWNGPYDLRPDQSVYCCVTGNLRNRLVVAGVVGEEENVRGVKLWEAKGDLGLVEMAEMPKEMVEKLKGEGGSAVASIVVTAMGDFVYLVNLEEPEEMVVCEVVNGGGGCRWWSVRNAVVNDGTRMRRMVFGGGDVSVEDLQRAVSENRRFAVKQM